MNQVLRPLFGTVLTGVLALGLATPAAAAGSPAPQTSTTAPGASSSGSAAAGTSVPSPTPGAAGGTQHPVDVGGVLFVSGVRTTYHRSWNPLGGSLHVELTVRNATAQVLDASASLGATTLVGVDLGGADSIAVRGLNPGEVRTVGADIRGVGQWGVLRAHMTVTPPASLGGVALQPLTRDGWRVVPPWYLVGVLALGAAAPVVLRRYRLVLAPSPGRRRRAQPAVVP